jgi:hypothetical protein
MGQAPNEPILTVVFYKTEEANEPVREWLKALKPKDHRRRHQDSAVWLAIGDAPYPKSEARHLGSSLKHQSRHRTGVFYS